MRMGCRGEVSLTMGYEDGFSITPLNWVHILTFVRISPGKWGISPTFFRLTDPDGRIYRKPSAYTLEMGGLARRSSA
jgi:hypothetical protein